MLLQRAVRPLFRKPVAPTLVRYEGDFAKAICLRWAKFWAVFGVVALPANAILWRMCYHTSPEDHSPPEFREYDHIRIRTKPFPFKDGEHSLLHNEYVNALKSGFEKDFNDLHH
ncbi:cytochrome c oxidase subunit 6A, mitochondrial-like [Ruditapes philippinarum]|uniref:cytochrome c oxidase subunit 6A, mitochondrial-like n=1 Tax=Ruditapes philippinarum TaxID=129788 RepID=UPI001E721F73